MWMITIVVVLVVLSVQLLPSFSVVAFQQYHCHNRDTGLQQQQQQQHCATTFSKNNRKRSRTLSRVVYGSSRRESSSGENDNDDYEVLLKARLEEQRRLQLVRAVLQLNDDNVDDIDSSNRRRGGQQQKQSLTTVELVGQCPLPRGRGSVQNQTISCAVLTSQTKTITDEPRPCLLVPLERTGQLRLLELAAAAKNENQNQPLPLSKTQLLRWNMELVNRDNGLFDNLPWGSWTVDPYQRNRDAAGNVVLEKFQFGKRDAYNRFMGKDWKQTLAQRLQRAITTTTTNEKKDSEDRMQAETINTASSTNYDENVDDDDFGFGDAGNDNHDDDSENNNKLFSDNDITVLTRRILELQRREQDMQLAEYDSQLAFCRQQQQQTFEPRALLLLQEEEDQLCDQRNQIMQSVEETKQRLLGLSSSPSSSKKETTTTSAEAPKTTTATTNIPWLSKLLEDMNNPSKAANKKDKKLLSPYRGATGYAPMPQAADDDDTSSSSSSLYKSPFDLLQEMIHNQLNAEVIGCVLENISWLPGNTALGGAVILRRKVVTKTVNLFGGGVSSSSSSQQFTVTDEDEDIGNPGVTGGSIYLVECAADEAIGMAVACRVALQVETVDLWERLSVMAQPVETTSTIATTEQQKNREASTTTTTTTNNTLNPKPVRSFSAAALPVWKPSDPELTVLLEGQGSNRSRTERTLPLRVPRTTLSLFDRLFEERPSPANDDTTSTKSNNNNNLFPTDNPIQSLSELDALSNADKAQLLMQMSNFDGTLPRPRVLRVQEQQQQQLKKKKKKKKNELQEEDSRNPLDQLLLPLVDESVRRQYFLREAEQQGDWARVKELTRQKTKRQVALEQAQLAGNERLAQFYRNEAKLYESLRADVTQDEGSYSRFLDRDEWYERTRAQNAKRLDKKKFGNLLDGIE